MELKPEAGRPVIMTAVDPEMVKASSRYMGVATERGKAIFKIFRSYHLDLWGEEKKETETSS